MNITEGLKAKVLGSNVMKTNDQVAVRRASIGGVVGAWYISVSLLVVQRIADYEEVVSEDENSKEALLAMGAPMVTELAPYTVL